jgi:hypothetical protein
MNTSWPSFRTLKPICEFSFLSISMMVSLEFWGG